MKNVAIAALIFFVSSYSSVGAINPDKSKKVDSATTATTDSGSNYVWTLEKMLMATAMPMTGEERKFLQDHKSLDGIRDWSFADFSSYVTEGLGKKHVAEEAGHWQSVLKMLKEETAVLSAQLKEPPPNHGEETPVLDNKAIDELLQKTANDAKSQELFKLMKTWRNQISILAPYVESMRKKTQPTDQS